MCCVNFLISIFSDNFSILLYFIRYSSYTFYSGSKRQRYSHALNQRINDYIDGFTIHGLTKVFRSQRKEAFVWFFFISVGILFASVVIGRLISKYYKFETYTDVRRIITDRNTLPSMSVCDFEALQREYFYYCKSSIGNVTGNGVPCNRSTFTNDVDVNNVAVRDGIWSNFKFEVVYCVSWDANSRGCVTSKNFTSRMNGACFTWNYDGTFHDDYSHVDFKFKLKTNTTKTTVIVVPHDPEITEIDITKKITIEAGSKYEITIGKTLLVRKAEPYSKCQTSAGSRDLDVFPGAYSRRTCIITYKQMAIFKECGDIFDHIRSFLPKETIQLLQQNKTIKEVQDCVRKNFVKIKGPPKEICPFPCSEMSLRISPHSYKQDNAPQDVYDVELQLESVDSYTLMEEQPIYSLEQLSAEIGGFLGLVVGASFLSFIEMFICATLVVLKKCLCTNK